MATDIFYSKDPPLSTHNDEPQVLGKLHEWRLLLERGVSHSQTALAINYRSVCSLRQGLTSRSWYFILPKHYLIQWHISIVNSMYSHLKYNPPLDKLPERSEPLGHIDLSWPLPSLGPNWLSHISIFMKVDKTSYLSMLPNYFSFCYDSLSKVIQLKQT
jgi:hypothetical protein